MDLNRPLTYIKKMTAKHADIFHKNLNLSSLNDLLYFFPFRYIDRSRFYKIDEITNSGADVQIIGNITSLMEVNQKRGSRLVGKFQDETGSIELIWFKGQQWIRKLIQPNKPYVVCGKLNFFNKRFSIVHPEMYLLDDYRKTIQSKLYPVYPSSEQMASKGISRRIFREYVQSLIQQIAPDVKENLPEYFVDVYNLLDKRTSILNVHFPQSLKLLEKAQYRLKFEELFFIQLQLLKKKRLRKQKIKGYVFESVGRNFHHFYQHELPFDLTHAQKRVMREIRKDLRSNAHMNRLLQGDVGSGKTIVALLIMLLAIDNGFQATIMAPTEILAVQHYNAINELLTHMEVSVALLTGSTKSKKRKEIHKRLIDGELNILIGTHALLEDKVQYNNLGIAIIDEQHRFGVAQRSKMWHKNRLPPHILVMTATPIPRTLAMSVYGDLDISVIDELPPGRKEVKTVHRYDNNRLSVFHFMKQEITKGRQIYVVYPLIQESEVMDYKDLMDGYESISRAFPNPNYQISIVHGKMKAEDKEFEMQRFIKGQTQIMVATTVIEVGVNVPNASVMVIESAERFGLSQLHQLRGRVGRGADQSYCILLSSFKLSSEAKTRLKTMVETSDGFKIAEVDLKLRGPGNMMGTQQSGILRLKIADVVKDTSILYKARQAAIKLLEEDPNLSKPENVAIKNTYTELSRKTGVWSNIS
ncbi:MAG: ATP-dependent DNA helicase RecG [Flavobacteriaceae bacterium]|nr:ATP-dependent DNA helicase RecG [Flavobacteriaceae bacterium]